LEQEQARRKVRWLLEAGVAFFLDLTEEDNLEPYAPLLRREATFQRRSVKYQRMPIRNMATPTPEEMIAILDTIDTALAMGHTIYVHCQGGIGRTGTVVGCCLVRHGMGGEDALEEIARLRRGTPREGKSSPFRKAQRQVVLNWPVGR